MRQGWLFQKGCRNKKKLSRASWQREEIKNICLSDFEYVASDQYQCLQTLNKNIMQPKVKHFEATGEVRTAGSYRKEIYTVLTQVMKRDLTENEHAYLSNLLKQYVDSHAPEIRFVPELLDNTKPIERHYICAKCKSKHVGIGHGSSRAIKKQSFETPEEALASVKTAV